MFGYNHPNLKELLGYPYLAWVIALATVRLAPDGAWRELATFGYYAVCINVAIVPSIYLIKQFVDYEKGEDDPAPISQPVKAYLDMNKADERGNVYAINLTGVRFDARRNLARALLGEWEHHGEIDATETAWLKSRVNSIDPRRKLPKRWQGKDNDFRKCKQDWEQAGILGRENPGNEKSRFIVRDPERLRAIVQGRL